MAVTCTTHSEESSGQSGAPMHAARMRTAVSPCKCWNRMPSCAAIAVVIALLSAPLALSSPCLASSSSALLAACRRGRLSGRHAQAAAQQTLFAPS